MNSLELSLTRPMLSTVRPFHVANRAEQLSGTPDMKWVIYGDGIERYQENFEPVLGGETIVDIVNGRKSPVVIDIMAPSDTLASLFKQVGSAPTFGLAVSLGDRRDENKKLRDEALNISQLTGDIMLGSTWRQIREILQGRKADLIMERAVSGLYQLPVDFRFYAILVNKAWNILSDNNGVLLLELPFDSEVRIRGVSIRRWVDLLNRNDIMASVSDLSLKIIKSAGSPEDLPLLSFR